VEGCCSGYENVAGFRLAYGRGSIEEEGLEEDGERGRCNCSCS